MSLSTWMGSGLAEILGASPDMETHVWPVVAPRATGLSDPVRHPEDWRVIRQELRPDGTRHLWIVHGHAQHEDRQDGRG